MNENQSKTIVVLGVHRSGTSLIGGVLDILSVDMGDIVRIQKDTLKISSFKI